MYSDQLLDNPCDTIEDWNKILEFLENKTYKRIGGYKPYPIRLHRGPYIKYPTEYPDKNQYLYKTSYNMLYINIAKKYIPSKMFNIFDIYEHIQTMSRMKTKTSKMWICMFYGVVDHPKCILKIVDDDFNFQQRITDIGRSIMHHIYQRSSNIIAIDTDTAYSVGSDCEDIFKKVEPFEINVEKTEKLPPKLNIFNK